MLFEFYGISTFVGYLMPNPFYYTNNQFFFKQFSLAQVRSLNVSTQFNCQKHFYFRLSSLVKQLYFKQFSLV